MSTRRRLTFDHPSEVMPEVDRLLGGYTRGGQWSLGQISHHLATALRYSVEGWPALTPWFLRRTIGPHIARRVLRTGVMPEGIALKPVWNLTPPSDLDDRAEAESLRGALLYYQGCTGPYPEHPFFGRLKRHQLDRLLCVHSAHHLSFLHPADRSPA